MNNKGSRRFFLRSSFLAGISTVISGKKILINDLSEFDQANDDGKNLCILFQGDSITDGNRGRNKDPNHIMGHGYAFSIASRVGADFPSSNISFYNRGVSGNKITDLEDRWEMDTLDIKPDVLSILIGINDASMLVYKAVVEEKDLEQFENTYRGILQQSQQLNPDILFVIGLPFVYPVGGVKDKWETYRDIVLALIGRIKKLAVEFNAVIVDFPAVFNKAIKKAPIEYWIWDGIHPTVPAHELMAREWIKQVSTHLKFLKMYKYQ